MERDAIRSLIEAAYGARVRGDLDGVMAAFHPGCDFQLVAAGGPDGIGSVCGGAEAVRAQIGALIEAFDFADFTIVDLLVDGERAALRWRAQVTARATGRKALFEVVDLFGFAEGRIRTMQQFTDTAAVAALMNPAA
jgi:ketosteroid isomerase-like protein